MIPYGESGGGVLGTEPQVSSLKPQVRSPKSQVSSPESRVLGPDLKLVDRSRVGAVEDQG